ncbi:hypothetical protein MANES_11G088456v8 [Manihot esculenta]|uniref:Uncharacterized protein n=1 Tax=Manihot esculenta TaxID=3983 RepID=A0ACB7GVR2_MANES|nr:hypothetical protein MANES_11G088456v8 [Manihot esculenta]
MATLKTDRAVESAAQITTTLEAEPATAQTTLVEASASQETAPTVKNIEFVAVTLSAPASPSTATPATATFEPDTRFQVTAEFSAPADFSTPTDFAAAPAVEFSAPAKSPTATPATAEIALETKFQITAENPAMAEPPVAREEAEIQAGNLHVQPTANKDNSCCPPAENSTITSAIAEPAVQKSASAESATITSLVAVQTLATSEIDTTQPEVVALAEPATYTTQTAPEQPAKKQ